MVSEEISEQLRYVALSCLQECHAGKYPKTGVCGKKHSAWQVVICKRYYKPIIIFDFFENYKILYICQSSTPDVELKSGILQLQLKYQMIYMANVTNIEDCFTLILPVSKFCCTFLGHPAMHTCFQISRGYMWCYPSLLLVAPLLLF